MRVINVRHDNRRLRVAVAVIGVASIIGVFSGSASANTKGHDSLTGKTSYPPVTLTLEDYFAPTDPWTNWLNAYAAKVLKDTDGAVKIQVYPNAELVSEANAPTAVQSNSVSMGPVPDNDWNTYVPGIGVAGAPFFITTWAQTIKINTSAKVRAIARKALAPIGIIPLMDCSAGFNIVMSKTPLTSISQFAGVKIRVGNAGNAPIYSAWGADPATIALGEVYEAVQLGTVSAITISLTGAQSNQFVQVAPYIDMIPVAQAFSTLSINSKAFAELSTSEQKILTSDAANMAKSCTKGEENFSTVATRDMVAAGGKVETPKSMKPYAAADASVLRSEETASPLAEELTKVDQALIKQ